MFDSIVATLVPDARNGKTETRGKPLQTQTTWNCCNSSGILLRKNRADSIVTTESQAELIETLIQQNRDGMLLIDDHGRIVTHNNGLVELLAQPAGTRFETTLRLGPVNLQRLLVRAAIAAGEQDAVGRPGVLSLDFRAELDLKHRSLPVRITSVPLPGGPRRLRLITLRLDLSANEIAADPSGFSPGSPLESADTQSRSRLELARRAVAAGTRLLLLGETGTGKTLLAQTLHHSGPRAAGSLVEIHCASLPQTMLGSELFGHVRGAFPGASTERTGRLEDADGGTLLLDEIGSMSPPLRAVLHRVLGEGRFERLGDNRTRSIDIQVISTSSHAPEPSSGHGRLDAALYHRIAGLAVTLPPLRERPDDLDATIERWSRHTGIALTGQARNLMHRHDWPGNFRELRNLFGVLCLHAEPGDRLDADALREALENSGSAGSPAVAQAAIPPAPFTAEEEHERQLLLAALAAHEGNRSRAARSLGMDRTTLWRKLHRLRLVPDRATC